MTRDRSPELTRLIEIQAAIKSRRERQNMGSTMTQTEIRWMIRRDLPAVLEIEAASFDHPLGEDDLIRCLRSRDCIGMVTVDDETVTGFMVYRLAKSSIEILNFAVAPESRREGVGRAMIEKLLGKLSPDRRRRLFAKVSERNLNAQLFFKACGFLAVTVLHYEYESTDDDAYMMEFTVPTRIEQ